MMSKEDILGKNLRELRLARRLKQEEVARALDIPTPTYSSWERGRTEPDINGLLTLARYFYVPVSRLLMPGSHILRIGSWIPPEGKFHPIKNPSGLYGLIYHLVFNRLYYYDINERRFIMELVDSWRSDRIKPSYNFYLRNGVTFQYGDPLEPEDVKRSYDLFFDLHPFFRQFVDSVEVGKQEHAIELRLSKWLEIEDLPTPYILPRKYVDDDECFEGTGPFKLNEKEQRKRLRLCMEHPLELEGNNSYFGKVPSIEAIEFHISDDPGEPTNHLNDYERCQVYTPFYLVLGQGHDICEDENLRKALTLSIDAKRIVRSIGTESAHPLPKSHLFRILCGNLHLEEEDDCDPEKSLTSLRGTGIANTPFKVGSTHKDSVTLKIISEIIDQLREADIDAEQEDDPANAHAFVEAIAFNDPESIYKNLHSSQQSGRPWQYNNAYMDHLLDNIEGIDTYIQIQEILKAESFFIPLLHRVAIMTYIKTSMPGLNPNMLLYGPDIAYWEFK